MGIKVFNKLPSHLRELVESRKIFKRTLKNILAYLKVILIFLDDEQ
jgi:hypothetical protein